MLVDFFIKKNIKQEKIPREFSAPIPMGNLAGIRNEMGNGNGEHGSHPRPHPTPPLGHLYYATSFTSSLSFFPFSLVFHRTSAALVVAHFENATLDPVASNSRRC